MERNQIKSSHYRFLVSAFLGLLLFLFVSQTKAVLIEALPSAAEINLGDAFHVDLVISGLETEVVRAFRLDLAYDSSIINATDVSFGNSLYLDHFLWPLRSSDISAAGYVMAQEVSLWSNAYLEANQPDSFVLASIGFDAIGEGQSAFEFLSYLNFGIDIKGADGQVMPVDVQDGFVNVGPASIPEPATLFLLGIGLLMMAQTQKKKYQSENTNQKLAPAE